jgi:hypothetical protein
MQKWDCDKFRQAVAEMAPLMRDQAFGILTYALITENGATVPELLQSVLEQAASAPLIVCPVGGDGCAAPASKTKAGAVLLYKPCATCAPLLAGTTPASSVPASTSTATEAPALRVSEGGGSSQADGFVDSPAQDWSDPAVDRRGRDGIEFELGRYVLPRGPLVPVSEGVEGRTVLDAPEACR